MALTPVVGLAEPPKVLDFVQADIGPITVLDQGGSRRLLIGAQVQGGAFLEPGPSVVSLMLNEGPGPISESHYQAALLMLGTQPSNQRIAVAGLGAGSGVVGLLANFPGMTITVVELSSDVIRMARQWFPLIAHYEAEGRLTILQHDFEDVLAWAKDGDIFDVAVMDAYSGTNNLATVGYEAAAMVAKEVWVNFIGTTGDPRFHTLARQLRQVGHDIAGYGQACDPAVIWTAYPRNILVTSQAVDLKLAGQFVPFREVDGVAADGERMRYRNFLATWRPSGVVDSQ